MENEKNKADFGEMLAGTPYGGDLDDRERMIVTAHLAGRFDPADDEQTGHLLGIYSHALTGAKDDFGGVTLGAFIPTENPETGEDYGQGREGVAEGRLLLNRVKQYFTFSAMDEEARRKYFADRLPDRTFKDRSFEDRAKTAKEYFGVVEARDAAARAQMLELKADSLAGESGEAAKLKDQGFMVRMRGTGGAPDIEEAREIVDRKADQGYIDAYLEKRGDAEGIANLERALAVLQMDDGRGGTAPDPAAADMLQRFVRGRSKDFAGRWTGGNHIALQRDMMDLMDAAKAEDEERGDGKDTSRRRAWASCMRALEAARLVYRKNGWTYSDDASWIEKACKDFLNGTNDVYDLLDSWGKGIADKPARMWNQLANAAWRTEEEASRQEMAQYFEDAATEAAKPENFEARTWYGFVGREAMKMYAYSLLFRGGMKAVSKATKWKPVNVASKAREAAAAREAAKKGVETAGRELDDAVKAVDEAMAGMYDVEKAGVAGEKMLAAEKALNHAEDVLGRMLPYGKLAQISDHARNLVLNAPALYTVGAADADAHDTAGALSLVGMMKGMFDEEAWDTVQNSGTARGLANAAFMASFAPFLEKLSSGAIGDSATQTAAKAMQGALRRGAESGDLSEVAAWSLMFTKWAMVAAGRSAHGGLMVGGQNAGNAVLGEMEQASLEKRPFDPDRALEAAEDGFREGFVAGAAGASVPAAAGSAKGFMADRSAPYAMRIQAQGRAGRIVAALSGMGRDAKAGTPEAKRARDAAETAFQDIVLSTAEKGGYDRADIEARLGSRPEMLARFDCVAKEVEAFAKDIRRSETAQRTIIEHNLRNAPLSGDEAVLDAVRKATGLEASMLTDEKTGAKTLTVGGKRDGRGWSASFLFDRGKVLYRSDDGAYNPGAVTDIVAYAREHGGSEAAERLANIESDPAKAEALKRGEDVDGFLSWAEKTFDLSGKGVFVPAKDASSDPNAAAATKGGIPIMDGLVKISDDGTFADMSHETFHAILDAMEKSGFLSADDVAALKVRAGLAEAVAAGGTGDWNEDMTQGFEKGIVEAVAGKEAAERVDTETRSLYERLRDGAGRLFAFLRKAQAETESDGGAMVDDYVRRNVEAAERVKAALDEAEAAKAVREAAFRELVEGKDAEEKGDDGAARNSTPAEDALDEPAADEDRTLDEIAEGGEEAAAGRTAAEEARILVEGGMALSDALMESGAREWLAGAAEKAGCTVEELLEQGGGYAHDEESGLWVTERGDKARYDRAVAREAQRKLAEGKPLNDDERARVGVVVDGNGVFLGVAVRPDGAIDGTEVAEGEGAKAMIAASGATWRQLAEDESAEVMEAARRQFSEARAKFSVRGRDELRRDIEDALRKGEGGGETVQMKRREEIVFSDDMPFFASIGLPSRRVVSDAAHIRKLRNKHGLDADAIASIPAHYEDPVAVFRDGAGAYVVLTDLKAETDAHDIKPVMVRLHERKGRNGEFMFIASAYPREASQEAEYVRLANTPGAAVYFNESKVAALGLEEGTTSTLRTLASRDDVAAPKEADVGIIPNSAAGSQGGAPRGVQKSAVVEYPDAGAEISGIRFKVGAKRREEYARQLAKHRPDLDAEKVLAELDRFDDTKKEKVALHWVVRGGLALPQDAYKIDDALSVAEKAKVDPFRYKSPDELLLAHKDFKPTARAIDPATVPELSKPRDEGDGIVSYEVADTREGQAAMRRIIDTHWGEDANPWCLLARTRERKEATEDYHAWLSKVYPGQAFVRPQLESLAPLYKQETGKDAFAEASDESRMSDAWDYWNQYNALPKRVAFKDGRLLAFMATHVDQVDDMSGEGIAIARNRLFPEWRDEYNEWVAEAGRDAWRKNYNEWLAEAHPDWLSELIYALEEDPAAEEWWDRQDESHPDLDWARRQFSEARAKFSVRGRDELRRDIEDALRKGEGGHYGTGGSKAIRYGDSLPVMDFLGVKMNGVFTTADRVRKMVSKHFLTPDQIGSLASASERPAAVFLDIDGKGSHVILTDVMAPPAKDAAKKPVMILLRPDKKGRGGYIASAYSRTADHEASYAAWKGRLRYLDKDKIAGLNLEGETVSQLEPRKPGEVVKTAAEYSDWSSGGIIPNSGDGSKGSAPRGVQKSASVEYPDAVAEISGIRFKVGAKRREEYARQLAKHRPDLDANAVLDELDKFNDTKKEKVALHWVVRGAIRLPEDAYKVEDALSVAEKAKVDPFAYKSPLELIEAHRDIKPTRRAIDPATVPELSDPRDEGDGIVSYKVADTREGQAAMRRIIDTHWGEDANPWCLLARTRERKEATEDYHAWLSKVYPGQAFVRPQLESLAPLYKQETGKDAFAEASDESRMSDAWDYWNQYDALPKRVAFKDGKLLAFMATDYGKPTRVTEEGLRRQFENGIITEHELNWSLERLRNPTSIEEWWDRKDESHPDLDWARRQFSEARAKFSVRGLGGKNDIIRDDERYIEIPPYHDFKTAPRGRLPRGFFRRLADSRNLKDFADNTSRLKSAWQDRHFDDVVREVLRKNGESGREVFARRDVSAGVIRDLFKAWNTSGKADEKAEGASAPSVAELFNLVLPVAEKLGVKFRFGFEDGVITEDLAYWTSDGSITYNLNRLAEIHPHFRSLAICSTLCHELIHGISSHALLLREGYKSRKIYKTKLSPELQKLADDTLRIFDKEKKNLKGLYGGTNAHEMLAELSNPDFVAALVDNNKTSPERLAAILVGFCKNYSRAIHDSALKDFNREAFLLTDIDGGSVAPSWLSGAKFSIDGKTREWYDESFLKRAEEHPADWSRHVVGHGDGDVAGTERDVRLAETVDAMERPQEFWKVFLPTVHRKAVYRTKDGRTVLFVKDINRDVYGKKGVEHFGKGGLGEHVANHVAECGYVKGKSVLTAQELNDWLIPCLETPVRYDGLNRPYHDIRLPGGGRMHVGTCFIRMNGVDEIETPVTLTREEAEVPVTITSDRRDEHNRRICESAARRMSARKPVHLSAQGGAATSEPTGGSISKRDIRVNGQEYTMLGQEEGDLLSKGMMTRYVGPAISNARGGWPSLPDGKTMFNIVGRRGLERALGYLYPSNGKRVLTEERLRDIEGKVKSAWDKAYAAVSGERADRRGRVRNWQVEEKLGEKGFSVSLPAVHGKKLRLHFTGAYDDNAPRFEYAGEGAKLEKGAEARIAAGGVTVADVFGDDSLPVFYEEIAASPVVMGGKRGYELGTVVLRGLNRNGAERKVKRNLARFEVHVPKRDGKEGLVGIAKNGENGQMFVIWADKVTERNRRQIEKDFDVAVAAAIARDEGWSARSNFAEHYRPGNIFTQSDFENLTRHGGRRTVFGRWMWADVPSEFKYRLFNDGKLALTDPDSVAGRAISKAVAAIFPAKGGKASQEEAKMRSEVEQKLREEINAMLLSGYNQFASVMEARAWGERTGKSEEELAAEGADALKDIDRRGLIRPSRGGASEEASQKVLSCSFQNRTGVVFKTGLPRQLRTL